MPPQLNGRLQLIAFSFFNIQLSLQNPMPEHNVATCYSCFGYTCDINGHDGIDIIPASLGWKKNHVNY